jgi:hypothetical protein
MNIAAGQWWEDGRGDRVKIVHVATEIHEYPVLGIRRRNKYFISDEWTAEGWYDQDNHHRSHNLVKQLPECTGWDWEPPKPVEAGEGWRLLEAGEVIQRDDQFHEASGWKQVFDCFVGEYLVGTLNIRRGIQPDLPADWKLVGGVPGGMLYFRSTEGT